MGGVGVDEEETYWETTPNWDLGCNMWNKRSAEFNGDFDIFCVKLVVNQVLCHCLVVLFSPVGIKLFLKPPQFFALVCGSSCRNSKILIIKVSV